MNRLNLYQVIQLILLFLLIAFGAALLIGWVTVPDGTSGEWFKQVWVVFLLILSPQSLAAIIAKSDGVDNSTSVKLPDIAADKTAGFASLRLLLALTCLVTILIVMAGCTTVSCSLQSGERNTIKSDQDQTPTSPISTTVQGIPKL